VRYGKARGRRYHESKMSPLVRGAGAVLVFTFLGLGAKESRPSAAKPSATRPDAATPGKASDGLSSVCPAGTLPDGDSCVPIPADSDDDGEELLTALQGHHDKRGLWQVYEQIPRLPDRPEDYGAYRYPVAGSRVLSGYDLDRPDADQRRGRSLSHVGHGGVDLAQARGAEVRAVTLVHQEGDAQVLYAGTLFGTTVLTRHTVREGGRLHDYVLLYGHLEGTAPGIEKGRSVAEGGLLGFVGDSGSPGIVHLHLEVRKVRDGVDVLKETPQRVMATDVSVACDPRNVLPLAEP
jgi:murein DD-endopeptidase MepM/ murein hydrolase activator NlpD